jgi:hypothetical protein
VVGFQELVAERLLGRVFGLQAMLVDIAYVIAFLSAGLLLNALGVRSVFAIGGSMLLALTIAGWLARPGDETTPPGPHSVVRLRA